VAKKDTISIYVLTFKGKIVPISEHDPWPKDSLCWTRSGWTHWATLDDTRPTDIKRTRKYKKDLTLS